MTSDQRRDPRFDTNHPVSVRSGDMHVTGSIRNISTGGAAVEFAPTLDKQDVVFDLGDTIELHPEGSTPVRATVVRYDDGAIAMKFDEPEKDLLELLVGVVRESLEPKR